MDADNTSPNESTAATRIGYGALGGRKAFSLTPCLRARKSARIDASIRWPMPAARSTAGQKVAISTSFDSFVTFGVQGQTITASMGMGGGGTHARTPSVRWFGEMGRGADGKMGDERVGSASRMRKDRRGEEEDRTRRRRKLEAAAARLRTPAERHDTAKGEREAENVDGHLGNPDR